MRPFFHEEVVERIRSFAAVEQFENALDVGCGSGQSTVALAACARNVVGIDASQSMLDEADSRPNIAYRRGRAEQLDFADGAFDLVTVGSAFHWFDHAQFFGECRRVLTDAGVLAVYNDHFTSHMKDVAACKEWMRTKFAKRFPHPWRGMRDMNELTAVECGFEVAHRSWFNHLVQFSRAEFIGFLLTRSNTLAAIHSGRETEESAMNWMDGELAPILPDGAEGAFIFKCNYWMMRKA